MPHTAHPDTLLPALRRLITEELGRLSVDPAEAAHAANRICARLCRGFGGESHWLPMTDRETRNAEILDGLRRGRSVEQVASAVCCSAVTVRRVLAESRRRQGLGRPGWEL